MVDLPLVVAAVLLVAMTVYVVSGGADFGAGIWEIFARGPRANEQKKSLREAIAPIWEANHVWLIIVVVLLFACFPRAFGAIMTALHIPLTVLLIGIVLRGAGFAFQSHPAGVDHVENASIRAFVAASAISPLMLGVCAGAVAGGNLRVDPLTGSVRTDYLSEWLAPFPFAVGAMLLALCAYLAAIYMTVETSGALREDFRRRALAAGVAVGACALLAGFLARFEAPAIGEPLFSSNWALPFHTVTGVAALGALGALATRRFRLARLLAVLQTSLIILGWGLAQYPYLITPDLTIQNAAASDDVLRVILTILVCGSIVLVPSFWWLYRVFKGSGGGQPSDHPR
jgi:cytochrome d ubiquinol oxidase subunit II